MTKYFHDKIQTVEFDLSSTCNAYCASCNRYVVEDGELKLNPYVNFNQNVSLEAIEQIFSSPLIDDNVGVPMVGSIGDPIANPQVVEIFQTILKYKPNARITAHTNGGLRTPEIFEQLGEISAASNKRVQLYFSIDGLSDTNHIYRAGVIWDKLIENAKAYIGAGGRARWKFIIFKWNEHQVETARQLSQELGFYEFTSIYDRAAGDQRELEFNPASKNVKKKEFGRLHNQEHRIKDKTGYIKPRTDECLDIQGIYVNADQLVVPCCKWATGLRNHLNKNEMNEFMYEDNISNWNSLQHYSFEQIMQNPWWDKLAASLQSAETSCTRCLVACSNHK